MTLVTIMNAMTYSYFVAMALSVAGLFYEVFIYRSESHTWLDFFGLLFVACIPVVNYVMALMSIQLFWIVLSDALDTPINKKR